MQNFILKTIGLLLNILCYVAPKLGAKIGFRIFCTPFGSKLKAHQKSYLNKATSIPFKLNDKILQAYKWGNGNTRILLVHGWAVNSARWKSLIDFLDPKLYTIFAFDAPAHGASEFKTNNIILYSHAIEAFIETHGSVHCTIAHSIGAATIISAAHNNVNNNYGNLIIMAAPGKVMDFFDYYQQMGNFNNRTIKLIYNRFIEILKIKPETFNTEELCKNITNKTLIIHDKQDLECPYQYAKILEKNMQHAELISTNGLGHSLKDKYLYMSIEQFIKTNVPKAIATAS